MEEWTAMMVQMKLEICVTILCTNNKRRYKETFFKLTCFIISDVHTICSDVTTELVSIKWQYVMGNMNVLINQTKVNVEKLQVAASKSNLSQIISHFIFLEQDFAHIHSWYFTTIQTCHITIVTDSLKALIFAQVRVYFQ